MGSPHSRTLPLSDSLPSFNTKTRESICHSDGRAIHILTRYVSRGLQEIPRIWRVSTYFAFTARKTLIGIIVTSDPESIKAVIVSLFFSRLTWATVICATGAEGYSHYAIHWGHQLKAGHQFICHSERNEESRKPDERFLVSLGMTEERLSADLRRDTSLFVIPRETRNLLSGLRDSSFLSEWQKRDYPPT